MPENLKNEFASIRLKFPTIYKGDIFHYLDGGSGDDLIHDDYGASGQYIGGSGNDTIISSMSTNRTSTSGDIDFGTREVDIITGGSGADKFIMANDYRWSGSDYVRSPSYFKEGNHAIITDFNENEGDNLILADDYHRYHLVDGIYTPKRRGANSYCRENMTILGSSQQEFISMTSSMKVEPATLLCAFWSGYHLIISA